MKIFEIISELHHVDPITNPLKNNDTITVYHGFNKLDHAILTAKYGLSGSERVSRVYSYESDNNPLGLFVTPSLKIAKNFTSSYDAAVVIQFNANINDLEAPVWPGGSFTGYGGYSQYFGHGHEGRRTRLKKKKDVETQYKSDQTLDNNIQQSDNPYLSHWLSSGVESQALFKGHLNPKDITQFFVRELENQLYTTDWYTMSTTDFLQKFEPYLKKYNQENITNKKRKLFAVDEEFIPTLFLERLQTKFKLSDVNETLTNITGMIISNKDKISTFKQLIGVYLWPKQMPLAFKWLIKTYGNKK